MPLTKIADRIERGLGRSGFKGSLKLDCGEDGVLVIRDDALLRGDAPADCTIAISADNLERLIAGKLNPMTGLMTGKLKVSGDASVAMRLGKLLKG